MVGPRREWPGNHFNLNQNAIDIYTQIPYSLEYKRTLGPSTRALRIVDEVKCASGGSFALKRIRRKQNNYDDEHEEMRYIKGELSIMKKMRTGPRHHFVELVGSYTDIEYVGILLYPLADCNLGQFLDRFHEFQDKHLLASFFGCMATALASLHCADFIRHKDIKPENFLVKGKSVLLTDFGIALDWSETQITTTNQEKRRSVVVSLLSLPTPAPTTPSGGRYTSRLTLTVYCLTNSIVPQKLPKIKKGDRPLIFGHMDVFFLKWLLY